jgi:branched-chain amino acid transport system ATP-binding protein
MTLLAVAGLVSGYRLGTVVDDVDLELEQGGALAVLGRNGVGKSTLMNTIVGLVRARHGSVRVDGRELVRKRTDVIARAGVAFVPQGRRVFAPLTVREHLRLSDAYCRRPGPWSTERILELFPRLGARMEHTARRLSGGEQQMLAVARALMTNPKLVLMDEPSDGLAPGIVRQIEAVLREIRLEGVGILLVEQDLRLAFAVSDEVRVMEKGRFVHAATVDEFRRDRATAARLLGVSGGRAAGGGMADS